MRLLQEEDDDFRKLREILERLRSPGWERSKKVFEGWKMRLDEMDEEREDEDVPRGR